MNGSTKTNPRTCMAISLLFREETQISRPFRFLLPNLFLFVDQILLNFILIQIITSLHNYINQCSTVFIKQFLAFLGRERLLRSQLLKFSDRCIPYGTRGILDNLLCVIIQRFSIVPRSTQLYQRYWVSIVPQNKVTVAPYIPNQINIIINSSYYLSSVYMLHEILMCKQTGFLGITLPRRVLDQINQGSYQLQSQMLFNLRRLVFFSRGKPLLRAERKKDTSESKVVFKNPYGIDLDKFDILDGLATITLNDSEKESLWINNLRNLYEENDQNSLEQLRNRQENIIKQIHTIQDIESKLPNLFLLKMSFNAKFRKWEEILVDCDNSKKLIKDPDYENQSEEELLRLYNKKCIGCIMNSHDTLHNFLIFKNNKLNKRVKRGKAEKPEQKDIGLFFYTSAEQRVELIQSNESSYELYFQTVLLQSIGQLVLGQRQQALRRLSKLTGNNFTLLMKQQVFVLIVIALSYQNNVKQKLSEGLKMKIRKMSSINDIQATQLSKCSLNAAEAEEIMNQISLNVHQKPISQLSSVQLKKYGRALCLIAQNSYLEGKKQESQRLFKLLEKLEEAAQIKMIVLFIKMGISFDSGNLEQALSYFQEYKKKEVDESNVKANKNFYDLNLINNDLLRINIYKLIVKVYKQLKIGEREEQIQEECQAMETTLLAYTLKQPAFTQEELDQELITNWRFKTEVRIPYYFFDLKLENHFKPNWDLDYSVS